MEPVDFTPSSSNKKVFAIILIVGVLVLAGLLAAAYVITQQPTIQPSNTLVPVEEQLEKQGALLTFATYQEAQEYVQHNSGTAGDVHAFGRTSAMFNMAEPGLVMDVATDAISETIAVQKDAEISGGTSSQDYSTTNIQVTGVDEADIVKSDGDYLYIVSYNNIYIVDATPAENAEIVSTIKSELQPTNIYIAENRLAVFGYNHTLLTTKGVADILPRSSYTYFHIYDTTDKANPELLREFNFEGNYTDSRLIGDYVYFLTTTHPNIYAADPIVPHALDASTVLCQDDAPDGANCPFIHYFDIPYPSQQLTTVSAINIKDADSQLTREVYMLGGAHTIYVSHNALYITNTKYLNEYQLLMEVSRDIVEPRLAADTKSRIAKIENTDSDVLTDNEKILKINTLIQQYLLSLPAGELELAQQQIDTEATARYKALQGEIEQTLIHKITLDDATLKSAGSGAVPGTVLNQFSMDERDGYFRIATTHNPRWSQFVDEVQESSNNMFVLNDDLDIVGELTGLAPDERIFSVRFMRDRAYMVTFQQVDPLFVIDLSEPTNPTVLGELKIPGFSNYLHPYNDNLLIGLGQDTIVNEFGGVRNNGVKLSLFDVSNVANPKEIDTYISSEPTSNSLAQNDHRAFLFSAEKNLLVIPINVWGKTRFNGALVFNIDESGFELKGTLDHEQSIDGEIARYGHTSQVKRSLYIDDILYTLSDQQLRMNAIDNLEDVSHIVFDPSFVDIEPYPIGRPTPEPLPVIIDELESLDIEVGAIE